MSDRFVRLLYGIDPDINEQTLASWTTQSTTTTIPNEPNIRNRNRMKLSNASSESVRINVYQKIQKQTNKQTEIYFFCWCLNKCKCIFIQKLNSLYWRKFLIHACVTVEIWFEMNSNSNEKFNVSISVSAYLTNITRRKKICLRTWKHPEWVVCCADSLPLENCH